MPAQISLSSSAGDFHFDEDQLPLVGRRMAYRRPGEQGVSIRRINVTLNGYFDGNNHIEIMEQVQNLRHILTGNDLVLYYHDGAQEIISNKRCYIDDSTDPEGWKEFNADYSLSLYYFEDASSNAFFDVSYSSDAGSYLFEKQPVIGFQNKIGRMGEFAPRTTLSGQEIVTTMQGTLAGTIFADTHEELVAKHQLLRQAFSSDGTLTYGGWTQPIFVYAINVPPIFPVNFFDYEIAFGYSPPGVIEFKASREFDRLHYNPEIKNLWYCGGATRVTLYGISGQNVSYELSIKASSVAEARSLLANECAIYTISGGIELPGGRERWNDTDNSVSVNYTKWYETPVLFNLEGT